MSRRCPEFYWTANEVRVARKTGPWYWLYLVAIDEFGEPLHDSPQMISDPATNVLENSEAWGVEAEVFKCTQRIERIAFSKETLDGGEAHHCSI